MATVTITKLDAHGRELFTYSGTLEYSSPDLVIVRARWDRLPPMDVGPLRLETGDIFLEHFYCPYWFNIFQVSDAFGTLKGWYCNIAESVTLSPGLVRWRDLALDLVVMPDGQQTVLDEDEFAALAIEDDQRRQARAAMDLLRSWAAQHHTPFTGISEPPAKNSG
ncbi:MAG: DUF402 domain-containing protein [Anaerolineae bacterium]